MARRAVPPVGTGWRAAAFEGRSCAREDRLPVFDDCITPDWWHDPVLLALDFTPVLACDSLAAGCAVAAHPAVWRCVLTCGCTLLLCDESLWAIVVLMLEVTDCLCPRCGERGAYIARAGGI